MQECLQKSRTKFRVESRRTYDDKNTTSTKTKYDSLN